MSAKSALRQDVLSRRSALTEAERQAGGRAIAAALAGLIESSEQVAAYAALASEPPLEAALAARTDVLIPVLLPDGDLDWARAGERLGRDAVAACDLVLVPALAVDRSGNRLGRGGGSYDRALRRATGLTIAVVYDGDLVDAVPTEAHDVRVSAVVTPFGGLMRF